MDRCDWPGLPYTECLLPDGRGTDRDGQTKENVTVRDRNDAGQIRIDKSRCVEYLHDKLAL